MAAQNRGSALKIRQTHQDGPSKTKIEASVQIRKSESSSKQAFDSKTKSTASVAKSEVKSGTKSASSNATAKKVREKKVFSLPGQKYDRPEEREPLRIFYESLSKQIPTSEMAEFWMMEHGLLSPDKAKKAFERKQKKQKELRSGTPIKSSKPPTNPESSHRQQQQQHATKNGDAKSTGKITSRSNHDDDDDDDFILNPKRRRG